MIHFNLPRIVYVAGVMLIAVAFLSTTVAAQSVKIEGLIKARDGETMIVQTSESPKLVVLLTDDTEVGQAQGMLKARRKTMSPKLRVGAAKQSGVRTSAARPAPGDYQALGCGA